MLTNPAVGPDVSPEAVLRTLSGLQVVQGGRVRIRSPGKRSATGETYRHGCPVHRNAKSPSVRMGSSLV